MMNCANCNKEFAEIEGAKYCPFCGKLLSLFFYTEEHDDFLKSHNNMHRKDLAEAFNKQFGIDKTVSSICHRCRRIGLEMPKEIRYESKEKATKGLPIGTERIYRGHIWVKISDENARHAKTRFDSKCWAQKHRYVWENAYGKIPSKMKIVFLDGNPLNCELENLAIATNNEMLLASDKMLFKSSCPETKKAALDWAKLYLVANARNELKQMDGGAE